MSGDLLQMTVYVGERARSGDRFTADALLDLYDAVPVAHSIVVRGIAGFGPRHELRSDVTLTGSEDPPIAVTAVDTAPTMARSGVAGPRTRPSRTRDAGIGAVGGRAPRRRQWSIPWLRLTQEASSSAPAAINAITLTISNPT